MELDDIRKSISMHTSSLPVLGQEDYIRTAVLLPLFKKEGEWHILFEERAAHIQQGGEICFPGGRMDPQDQGDSERCALRETIEELGINRERISIIGALGCEPAMRGMLVDVFVGILDITDPEELDFNDEVARVFSIPLTYFLEQQPQVYQVASQMSPVVTDESGVEKVLFPAKELKIPKKYHKPWGHHFFDIFVYEWADATIWGLTARLLRYFSRRLVNTKK